VREVRDLHDAEDDVEADRDERELWAEVTDSFGGNTFPETGTSTTA